MLTYAGVHKLQDILVQNLKCSKYYSEHVLSYDFSVVFQDGELVLFFDNMPFWRLFVACTEGGRSIRDVKDWGKRMERYCRLVIKLRAHRARLAAKGGHNGPPAKQPTSEAR
jgi:hypothetical protein